MDRIVEKTIKNLEKHYFEVFYYENFEQLKEKVKEFLNTYESFSLGGSTTLIQTGLKDFIIQHGKRYIERISGDDEEKKIESERAALLSDIYFMSTNAISSTGALINIDKRGNRVGALLFGPKKVVVIASTNKITKDIDSAIERAKNVAAVSNCKRFNLTTPCVKLQRCIDCEDENTICYSTVITKRSFPHKRISILLFEGNYGF
ncbi:MAG: lactate utilization protein [candidate division WOR-3 bacterium]